MKYVMILYKIMYCTTKDESPTKLIRLEAPKWVTKPRGGGKQLWPLGPRRAENVQLFQENNLTGRSPFLGVEMRIFETIFAFLKGAVSDTFGSSKVSHEAKGGWQAIMAVGA